MLIGKTGGSDATAEYSSCEEVTHRRQRILAISWKDYGAT
jgi:hypothetical protein